MAKFPALPLFTDAFIADTMHLNAQQTGAYLLLLMVAWRSTDCCLPDDDAILSRYARMDLRSWKANRETIMAFWKKDAKHKWYQSRLVDERKHAEGIRDKNVRAGRASALKRHETISTGVQLKVSLNSTTPIPIPIEEDTNVSSPPISPKKNFILPDWVPSEAWSSFCEMRVKAKKGMTDRAKALIVSELNKLRMQGHQPEDVLNQSTMRGWLGVFAVKPDFQQGQTSAPKKDYYFDNLARAAAGSAAKFTREDQGKE